MKFFRDCLIVMSVAVATMASADDLFGKWSGGTDPKVVGRRVVEQFLSAPPDAYAPKGCNAWHGEGKNVPYAVVSLWANAIDFALTTGDAALVKRLTDHFEPFFGEKNSIIPVPNHVDFSVFGAVPFAVYRANGDERALDMGEYFAMTQWAKPHKGQPPRFVHGTHNLPWTERLDLWERGYTAQTRFWIDDMYMIALLQCEATRATGRPIYVERAAQEATLYLKKLQKPNGLFEHGLDAPFFWCRGNGWVAGGLTLILKNLPHNSKWRSPVMAGYQKMMKKLLECQKPDGLWAQLVNETNVWSETSGSAMFTSAIVTGVRQGWLDARYAAAARKAYLALVSRLDQYANINDVCCGTGTSSDHEVYLKRPRKIGDPHGQAALMWAINAFLEEPPVDAVYRKGAMEYWTKHKRTSQQRCQLIDPVADGELRLRPTFTSCGVTWGAKNEIAGLGFQYRKVGGGEWQTIAEVPFFPEVNNYRFSLMDLAEAVDYEVRFVADSRTLATGSFRTWASDVPIAKTIEIDAENFRAPYLIDAKGAPDGWIRYTVKGGRTLENASDEVPLLVKGAKYVILEGMTVKGGPAKHCVVVEKSRGVRIRNCEFSDWGRDAVMDLYRCAGQWAHILSDGTYEALNYDGAIRIGRFSSETVVERCYIHDARYPASSWIHSHPAGPEAVFMAKPDHSTVLRWNDFVGSDKLRWNDAVESAGNFDEDGGFNRDADIDGNFMIFCNDDGIELDGGNQNVRCRYNRFEGMLCPVSVQGTMVSPSYVTDNLIISTGEEYDLVSSALKTCGSDMRRKGSIIHFDRNTCFGDANSRTIDVGDGSPTCRYRCFGNRFNYAPFFCNQEKAINGRFDDNLCDRSLDSTLPYAELPRRPVPYLLSVGRISGIRFINGKLDRNQLSVRLVCKGEGYCQPFKVRANHDVDWLEVTPSEGVIESGKVIDFTVHLKPKQIEGRRFRKGAFLVRTADGFSRPVSVDVETDFVPPVHCADAGTTVYAYDAVERPVDMVKDKWLEYEVTVPEEGAYGLMIHGGGDYVGRQWPELEVAVDDAKPGKSIQHTCARHYFNWTMLSPGCIPFSIKLKRFEMKPGRHRVRLRLVSGTFAFDALMFTKTPRKFEEI